LAVDSGVISHSLFGEILGNLADASDFPDDSQDVWNWVISEDFDLQVSIFWPGGCLFDDGLGLIECHRDAFLYGESSGTGFAIVADLPQVYNPGIGRHILYKSPLQLTAFRLRLSAQRVAGSLKCLSGRLPVFLPRLPGVLRGPIAGVAVYEQG